MKKGNFFWIGLGAVLIICAVVAGFLIIPRQFVEAKPHNLVGAWEAKIIVPQGQVSSLITMTSDGIILGEEVPDAYETTSHGNWISTGPNEARYTFVFIVGNKEIMEAFKGKIVGTFKYDPKTDSISGPFKITQVDPQGNHVFPDGEGMITGTRIQVEKFVSSQ